MTGSLILTTTNNIDGCYVEQYLGIISKEIVFRNGLGSSIGAAVTNFVSAFNFRDVELKGSSELISNAKEYLMEQFKREARSRGANAVLGVDFETTFGAEIVKVSVNGTAVRINGNVRASDNREKEEAVSSRIQVASANVQEEFIPVSIVTSPSLERKEFALRIIKKKGYLIGDMICNILIKSRFGDEFLIKNVCFLNFVDNNSKTAASDAYPVDIPDHIYTTMDSVVLIVKKAFCNEKLISFEEDTLFDVCQVVGIEGTQKTAQQVSLIELYKTVNNQRSNEEILQKVKANADVLDSELYQELEECAERHMIAQDSIRIVRKDISNILVAEINKGGGVDVIKLEHSGIRCPLCDTVQNMRKACFSCGVNFDVPNE